MAPVIRIDDEVMGELKKRAVALGLVFEPPNTTLRSILGLDNKIQRVIVKEIGIQLKAFVIKINRIYSAKKWALIPIPKVQRKFFPGYKVSFELITDAGPVKTHITSDVKGTPIGDANGGTCIQTGLRPWFDKHPELKDGSKLSIEILEPNKRYKLSIVQI
jgi:hypothetical protein